MKRLYLFLIPVGILVMLLSVVNYHKTVRHTKPMIKLVVWGMQPSEEAAGQRAMIEEFEKRHPGIDVSLLSMGAGTMNPQKLMTAIVGKKPPDVIKQDRFTIGDWASRDTFMPLDDLIKRDRDKPNGIKREDYFEFSFLEASYKGHVYAIPESTDTRFLYYNRDLFREAGLDPYSPPETWEELLEYAKKLTSYNKDGSFRRVGFIPSYGNSWLYLYSWQNGGELMSPNGRRCTLNNSSTQKALEYVMSIYDALKGAEKLNSYQQGFKSQELDPFLTGRVAMKIDVDQSLALSIARYAPDLDFGVAPAPVPAERYRQTYPNFIVKGHRVPEHVSNKDYKNYPKPEQGRFNGQPRFITWSGGFSYAIPNGSKHVELAWEFIKWMNSPEAKLIEAAAQQKYNRSKGRPYLPSMHANRKVDEAVFKAFGSPNPRFKESFDFALELMDYSKYRPVTMVGQLLWDEHVNAYDNAVRHTKTGMDAKAALDYGTKKVQRDLDRVFIREKFPVIPSGLLAAIVGGILLMALAVIYWKIRGTGKVGKLMRSEAIAGYLFASPWIIGFLVFTLGPIVVSIIFSFCDYDVIHDARWVGTYNYQQLFTTDWALFSKSLYNVAYLSAIGIPLGIITGLAIAMLLNSKVAGMTWYRTTYYLPSILPFVAVFVLWMWVLNPEYGIINAGWRATLGQWFGIPAPGWLSAPEWSKPSLIFMGLWGAGGGMILWLAGLQGIPQHLYEAAEIDGAGAWHKFRNVTLPMLTPYLFFNVIMGTIGALQTFESVYVMTGGGPVNSTLVPVMYLFTNAFTNFKMGYASALAWILFIIILALTLIQLKIAPRWVHYESEKGK